jgi:hypothetical protein
VRARSLAQCSLTGGCIADCSPPKDDPIATGNAQDEVSGLQRERHQSGRHGLQYVQTAISDYETVLYDKTWPCPAP